MNETFIQMLKCSPFVFRPPVSSFVILKTSTEILALPFWSFHLERSCLILSVYTDNIFVHWFLVYLLIKVQVLLLWEPSALTPPDHFTKSKCFALGPHTSRVQTLSQWCWSFYKDKLSLAQVCIIHSASHSALLKCLFTEIRTNEAFLRDRFFTEVTHWLKDRKNKGWRNSCQAGE